METEEAISLEELTKRCGCCFKSLNNLVVREVSKDIERKFNELVQYEFISKKFTSLICADCDDKLTTFELFKFQLQENQKNLQNSLSTYNKPESKVDSEVDFVEEYLDPEYEEVSQLISADSLTITKESEKKSRQICPICGKYFSSGSLDIHMKRKHSQTFNFFCDQCPQKFKIKHDLMSHIEKHTEVEYRKKYHCEYCENSYTKNSSLQHHIKMHHENCQEKFQCDCGAIFKTKLRLSYHKKITHEKGEYRCTECKKSYPSMHNLKIHISHFHAAKSPCIYCGKLVAPGTFMKRHIKIHEPASHECEICLRAFTVRETLLEHQRTVHQMGEMHYCENCGKSFGSKKVLKRHKERSHTIAEKVPCQVNGCSYAANRKDNLINHVKIHKDIDERVKTDIIYKIKSMRNLSW